MTKYKLEYIWLDGYKPVPNLRGKTQLKNYDSLPTLEELPLWGFDGSSTQQAEGHSSDCVLKPVAIYPDGARTNGLLVLCEVSDPYQIASQILKTIDSVPKEFVKSAAA